MHESKRIQALKIFLKTKNFRKFLRPFNPPLPTQTITSILTTPINVRPLPSKNPTRFRIPSKTGTNEKKIRKSTIFRHRKPIKTTKKRLRPNE